MTRIEEGATLEKISGFGDCGVVFLGGISQVTKSDQILDKLKPGLYEDSLVAFCTTSNSNSRWSKQEKFLEEAGFVRVGQYKGAHGDNIMTAWMKIPTNRTIKDPFLVRAKKVIKSSKVVRRVRVK